MLHSFDHNLETSSRHEAPDHDDSVVAPNTGLKGFEAFKERLYTNAKENGQLTQIDELRHLYDAGDQEELDTHIDDLVYDALQSDEEFMANMKTLKENRQAGGRSSVNEDSIRVRQNEIFNEYKRTLVSISGLPVGIGLDEYEVAKERVQDIIKNNVEAGTAREVLKSLGILTMNEKGDEIFSYPENLFPPETNKKWELYLNRVREHLKKERGVVAGTLEQEELETADRMRRLAHNSVTKDVDTILGLDKLPDSDWSFDKTRELLAKMRDKRYPTVETAEKARTTDQVLRAANILGILGTKISTMK